MALAQVNWSSKVLEKMVMMNVILPDTGEGPFPTFYLLHGLSDDFSAWHRRTRIEIYAAQYPMIVVMPDGFRGFYTDNNEGPRYAEYIGQELPSVVERLFPAKASRNARAIGGLSMGGYGALRIALGFPDRFCSATSHSGALMDGHRIRPRGGPNETVRIFGKNPVGSGHDLIALAKKAKAAGKLPRLRLDCGTEDFLLNDNRQIHAELDKLKVPHEYEEFPGNHNWDYWDVHVREALAFHARSLKLK